MMTMPESEKPVGPRGQSIGPTEVHDPVVRNELKRAGVWIGMALLAALIILLAQPILLIFGGIVLAAMLDGGARLLGRVLPIPRGLRLTLVVVGVFGFLFWTVTFAGREFASQFLALEEIVRSQLNRIGLEAQAAGLDLTSLDLQQVGSEVVDSLGRVTAAVTNVFGAVAGIAMMLVLAVFMAAEPRLYERGVAWMVPLKERANFYELAEKMGYTMRRLMAGRLLGMAVEGIGTWLLLAWAGVPMAALLGVLTGLLAFLPNIGAIISGALIILVGFSAGTETGILAILIYVGVQMVDGYLIVPMVAKRAVDLAPALVLGAQIIFGALFGILGLALADPIVAMLKVALERQSERNAQWSNKRAEKKRNDDKGDGAAAPS